MEAWEPGSKGGQAIADILYGKVNPSGKLPISVPRSVGQIATYYNHKPSHNYRKYVNNKTGALYPFGYGLSFSKFKYSNLSISDTLMLKSQSIIMSTDISNNSNISGDEVVQMYIQDEYASVTRPIKELKGFKRVSIGPGETKTVSFTITPEMLSFLDIDLEKVIEPGTFIGMIGSSSADEDLQKVRFEVK